jgi:hypothetical protein
MYLVQSHIASAVTRRHKQNASGCARFQPTPTPSMSGSMTRRVRSGWVAVGPGKKLPLALDARAFAFSPANPHTDCAQDCARPEAT